MTPILQTYQSDLPKLLLPWSDARFAADLPTEALATPDAIPAAEALLEKPVPNLPASLYREFYENGNRDRYEAPYFQRRRALLLLAAAEKTEGKGRFLDLLIDYLWAICEETSWVLPAHNTPRHGKTERLPDQFELDDGDDCAYIDLFSAATGADVAMVWYLLHDQLDALTPVITRRMLGLLEKRILHPFITYADTMWWKGSRGNVLNNWTPWIVSNVLTVVLLCEKDEPKRLAAVTEAITVLDRFIGFYKADGGCDEGPGYWTVAGASYFDCLELLWDLTGGGIDVFGLPLIRRMGEYIADVHITDNLYVNFADASHRLGVDPSLIARYGRRTGSAKLTAFAATLVKKETDFHTLLVGTGTTPYRTFRNIWEPVPEKATVAIENRTYYEGLEIFLAREDNGLFLAYKGGHNGESHNHNDIGNVVVFQGDKPVLIDGGVEQYTKKTFSAERYILWTMRSSYHNLPDIGDKEQSPGGGYHAALVEKLPDSVTYDLTAAWPADTGIDRYTRCGALANGKVTITDTLTLAKELPVTWHWLCAEKPVIEGSTLSFADAHCRMTITGADFAITCEPVALEKKLAGEWRTENLWRVCMTASHWRTGTMAAVVEVE